MIIVYIGDDDDIISYLIGSHRAVDSREFRVADTGVNVRTFLGKK